MLFTQHVNSLTASVNSIQNQIDELEAQLKGLRNDKSNLEAELQQILTLEGAAESAINQAQMFINAAESLNRDDLIETFWQAMDAMKNGAIAKLPEAPETDSTPESEPTNPIEPDNNPVQVDVITVEATEATEQKPEPTPTPTPTPTSFTWGGEWNSNEHEHELKSVASAAFNTKDATLEEIKAYVRSYQSDDKTKTQGPLTRKSTWVMAAKQIQKISDYTP